ncbi:SGNH/GDSL hydrolase family protein [Pseudomonas helleri]|uniref:Uncharacterized protein n=1 Tax=Pseudomonas helleri TaxID=1608996 RepID=A0A7X1Y6M6_9PSED|nr:SGNH/GDSL hydrolase family protein [Pseudomonas helleri]MQT93014.1 hypothetical protein [Pseudomonas helleri]MQU31156.1 hypothetical protein [Pseudomonas helleri]
MELKNFFAQDDQGNKLPGATCYLYQRGTENLFGGLYKTNGLPLANPFTTDKNGLVQFAAPNGIYDLRVVKGERDYRLHIQFNDVSETLVAAEAAADRAETAKDAAVISGGIKDDIEHGLRTTSPGENFQAISNVSKTYVTLYKNKGDGVAEPIDSYPNMQAIDELGIRTMDAEANDMSFALGDEDMNSSWLQTDRRGQPTRYAAKCMGAKMRPEDAPALIDGASKAAVIEAGFGTFDADANDMSFSLTDSEFTQSDLELDRQGRFTQRVINSIAKRIGISTVVPPFPLAAWACWGDSLTAGGWPTTLAALCGLPAYNGGWGGQGYSQIAARQGGVPARLTVAGNTIPATGSVTVTAALNNPLSDGGGRQGLLAGVLGMLNMAGGVLTFTRSAQGEAVSCPAMSYFTPADGLAHADRHVTIWIGRNSFKDVAPALIVASIRSMIDYLTPRVKRVIVMSIPPWVGEEFGTSGRARLDACNAAIAAAFTEFWLDISAWLRTAEAATAAGITFTSDDLADISNGLTPRSLRSDSGHLNALGNIAIGKRVYQESQIRGWM